MSALPRPVAPRFSAIVLNWNGAAHLPRCLAALTAQTWRDFETLVLDNASTDGSVDGLEAAWPGCRLARFERNLGFSAANNRGAEMAAGHWLAFLNNDAFPQPDWLAALAQAVEQHPQDSFFASCLVNAQAPQIVQAAGDVLHASGYAWPGRAGTPLAALPAAVEEVFSASGAAVVYERDAFLAAGGFDEAFVSHLEDVDLGFRLRLGGQHCWFVPGAVVEHVLSASYGLESPRTVFQVQRNATWLYWADMPGSLLWKYLPAHLLATLVLWLHYIRRGRGRAVTRARLAALAGLPAALRKRRRVQAARRVAPAQIEAWLDRGLFSPFLRGKLGRFFSSRK